MWKENLTLCNGRSLIFPPPRIIISSDASLQGWGVSCHRLRTVGPWSIEEKKFHMNVVELRGVKLAKTSFRLRKKNAILVQIRIDKMTVLSYLMKM